MVVTFFYEKSLPDKLYRHAFRLIILQNHSYTDFLQVNNTCQLAFCLKVSTVSGMHHLRIKFF